MLYKLYLDLDMEHVRRNVHICKNCSTSGRKNITIGDNTWIGDNLHASGEGGLSIGSGVIISHGVEIWSNNHNYNSDDLEMLPYDKRVICKPVVIKDYA